MGDHDACLTLYSIFIHCGLPNMHRFRFYYVSTVQLFAILEWKITDFLAFVCLISLVQFQRIDTFIIIYDIEAYCSVCIIVHLKCRNINSMQCGCLTHDIMKITYLPQFDISLRSRCSWSERWYRLYRHCLSWILNYALLRRTNLPIDNKFIISHPIFLKKIRNTEGCLNLQTATKVGCTNKSCRCFRRYLGKLTHN